MDNAETLKAIIKEYRRKTEDAEDDVAKGLRQLKDYEKKLDSLERYQEDCLQGYQSLEDNPFNHARRREFKLLLDKLDSVLEEQHARIDSCQVYIEKMTAQYKKYQTRLQQYRAQLKALNEIGQASESEQTLTGTTAEKVPASVSQKKSDEAYAWLKTGKI